jgi:hypothetical protein
MKLQELVPSSLQKKYGKVFLGQAELYQQMQKTSYEINTDAEKELIMSLQAWVDMSSTKSADEVLQFKDDLQRILKDNPWLGPPKGSDVYRYTVIDGTHSVENQKYIDSIIEEWESKHEGAGSKYFKSSEKYTYSAKRSLQSWSLGIFGAGYYKHRYITRSGPKRMPVLLHTKVTDNSFIFTPKLLYSILDVGQEFTPENETLRFNNSPISCNVILSVKDIEDFIELKRKIPYYA